MVRNIVFFPCMANFQERKGNFSTILKLGDSESRYFTRQVQTVSVYFLSIRLHSFHFFPFSTGPSCLLSFSTRLVKLPSFSHKILAKVVANGAINVKYRNVIFTFFGLIVIDLELKKRPK